MSTTNVLFPMLNSCSPRHQSNPLNFKFTDATNKACCHGLLFPPRNRRPSFLHWRCASTRKVWSSPAYVKTAEGQEVGLRNVEREGRIRKQLQKPEFMPSSYDTAWVAMVPLPGSLQAPCFPHCVEWILQNQDGNGSWGVNEFDASPSRDILLSTLACVIALKKWNVGPGLISRGLQYIGRNISLITDELTAAPIGFNLTFSYMLTLATGMCLEFPISETDMIFILHLREMEIKRLHGDKSSTREAYVSYVAEGLLNLLDRKEVMKLKRKNGSLFNSPSATAAALLLNYDDESFQYLNSIVSKFGSAVPTLYPINKHYQLWMVDTLKKMGISRHFLCDIKEILDTIYSLWSQGDEEIMMDVETSAMAFCILRMNGYDVSSDMLAHVVEGTSFNSPNQGYFNDIRSVLELHKASKVRLSEDELSLENIGKRSGSLLTEMLTSDVVQRTILFEEVERIIKFPLYATVEPLEHRWNIENFDAMSSQMLRTKHLSCGVNNDILAWAVEDFSISQSIYQDEVQQLYRWEKETRLGELQFARHSFSNNHLQATAIISAYEESEARIWYTKHGTITTVIDDFIDFGGSQEEVQNLARLVEKWDETSEDEFCSEKVKIIFESLYTTTNQIGTMASAKQNRDVRKHIIETWQCLMKAYLIEVEWRMNQYVPTFEEYLAVRKVALGIGPNILIVLYLLGIKLPEYVFRDEGYKELYRLMSTAIGLLNDAQTVEKEASEGKLSSVLLLIRQSGGSMSIEAAKEELIMSIATYMRDLLALILKEDSVVPRPCKWIFWTYYQSAHMFYTRTDGFSSPAEMIGTVDPIFYEPLKLNLNQSRSI